MMIMTCLYMHIMYIYTHGIYIYIFALYAIRKFKFEKHLINYVNSRNIQNIHHFWRSKAAKVAGLQDILARSHGNDVSMNGPVIGVIVTLLQVPRT